ncbi:hypothetical protein F7725_028352 [Dissostichus mawsoni]|uniref:Uncharacterized protein n=1 Tax=Dissostichus mawsoni TaxID=36200 RepID=A0A7J5XFJ9_DISMA|nr:hypothetical protein F7725_028352 [Dissostichus mawsoni]
MPPKAGRGRRKKLAVKYTQKRKPEETESPTRERKGKCKKYVGPIKTPERPQRVPGLLSSPKSLGSIHLLPLLVMSQPPLPSLQASPSLVGKGKGKAQKENPPPGVSYSFTEAQEEAIACWVKSKKLLYDIKDKQYKEKALKRQEGKAAEYRSFNSETQRTRFSKLREGQPKKKSQKRSGDGLSSGDEEDPILAEEATENDSDRDKFIRRVFGFLKPHIRRHNKETPASFKDKLALAETGELAGSDDSTMAGSFADEPREPTKKYTGYPTPRPPSRTGTAAEDQPESPMEMRVTGASSRDLQDRLVQFITREQPVNRSTPFCKYLETELDRLHDACLEPAYEEITTSQQERPVAVNPVCTSALPSSTYYSASRAASSPSAEFQPGPSQWRRNPPPASVWRSQECGYVEQVNQQHNLEQQQQYRTLQPASTTTQGYVPSPRQAAFFHLPPQQQISGPWQLTPQQPVQGPPPPPLPAQQSQHNVTQDSLNISALVPHDDN